MYRTSKSAIRFWATLFFAAMIIVVGTIGYSIIEGWRLIDSLYMTVITLSTVGFREVYTLSDAGHLFTIFLIIFGAVVAALTAKALAQLVLEGELQAFLGKRKMEKRVQKLKNHIILCGFGRVGREVAAEFVRRKTPFVILEQDINLIPVDPDPDHIFLQGNAADDEVLEHAGISRARAIVSTLPDDADNVYLALTARQINPKLSIIARAETALAKKKLLRAGADNVICPHELGGAQMAMATLRPNVVDFLQLASDFPGSERLGIEEIPIREGGSLTGKTIIEGAIKTKYDVIVIGLRKADGSVNFNPPGDLVMDSKDLLIALGTSSKLERLSADLS